MNTVNAANAGIGFQRVFLIFSSEDGGYEAGQKPSGHIKLEVREGKGKLHAAVQNLRPGNGRFVYKLYLLRTGGNAVAAAYAGQLAPEPNKAELDWSFDAQNIGASGISIGEFDTAAVLVEYADRPGDAVICPLAAYRSNKTEWRNGMRAALAKMRMDADAYRHIKTGASTVGIHDNADAERTALQSGAEFVSAGNMQMPVDEERQPEQMYFQQGYAQPEYPQQEFAQQEYAQPEYPQQEFAQQEYAQPEYPQQEYMAAEHPSCEYEADELPVQEYTGNQQAMQEQILQDVPRQEQVPQPPDTQFNTASGQIDMGCVYLNGNICGAFVNDGVGAGNPCITCRMHHGRPNYSEPPAGDVNQLREELDRYFEQCDPFHSNRSDYMWWRVSNPVNLNNLLYQCNIRSPLLFNPAVMMAHYKYRHLIVGIFMHRAREKQYVVCGVPGISMVDKKPFGDMSRWVQAEGNRPRYGAFGYWLVYIDPDGGKILSMS